MISSLIYLVYSFSVAKSPAEHSQVVIGCSDFLHAFQVKKMFILHEHMSVCFKSSKEQKYCSSEANTCNVMEIKEQTLVEYKHSP